MGCGIPFPGKPTGIRLYEPFAAKYDKNETVFVPTRVREVLSIMYCVVSKWFQGSKV